MEEEKKINVHQIFWYFVLFSMLGLAIETLYARFTMGIWESRKGFIWGPFCPIYGVGGTYFLCGCEPFREMGGVQESGGRIR